MINFQKTVHVALCLKHLAIQMSISFPLKLVLYFTSHKAVVSSRNQHLARFTLTNLKSIDSFCDITEGLSQNLWNLKNGAATEVKNGLLSFLSFTDKLETQIVFEIVNFAWPWPEPICGKTLLPFIWASHILLSLLLLSSSCCST